MSWKDILVISNSADHGVACVEAAAGLALDHGASLRVLIPSRIPQVMGWGEFPVAPNVLDQALAEVKKETKRTSKLFAEAAARAMPRTDPCVIETNLSNFHATIAEASQLADLVVVLQPTGSEPDSEDILNAVLFGSGRPVLMIPSTRNGATPHFGKRVLVAWKPGREASRALHDALPALQRAEAVRIFSGSEDSVGAAEYAQQLSRLSAHLVHHAVDLHAEDQRPSPRSLGILEAGRVWGADMIVMGAYGHARLQETVFGGATRDAIHHATLPVLFSH